MPKNSRANVRNLRADSQSLKSVTTFRLVGAGTGLALAVAAGLAFVHFYNARRPHYPIVPFETVRPVLQALTDKLPEDLQDPNESRWNRWAQRQDAAIRSRLEQGSRDSMINLLLFGTSFTDQPRPTAPATLQANDPLVQSRLNDFMRGLHDPKGNERLEFVARNVLGRAGLTIDDANDETVRAFILENFERVVLEHRTFRQLPTESASKHNGEFSRRGIALDTKILSSFGIDAALRDMKNRGVVHEGSIRRVAVIGPGLDFTDKGFGYDFYPLQTLQPFAIYDSLLRLGLGQGRKVDIVWLDISPEVLDHLRQSRSRVQAGQKYILQLPREARPWSPELIDYWQSFGTAIGQPVAPINPPPALKDLETRAVEVRPDVVMQFQEADLNAVLEKLNLPSSELFDLVVATNVFIYYSSFEQLLALQNVSNMLKPGGFFLTNDRLERLPEIPMSPAGYTPVRYGERENERDNIYWWQRQ